MPKIPSEKSRSLASSNKASELKRILETDLYPFLHRLPAAQQKSLKNIFTNEGKVDIPYLRKNEGVALVGYETRSNSISWGLKALAKSVESDWNDGWEEQGEIMSELQDELCEWLPILWKVGVEMGVEHALVHKSLEFCLSSLDDLESTDSRAEFDDYSDGEIKDATGRVVCRTTSTKDAILWVWRELLLSSIVHNSSDTVAKRIVAEIKNWELTEEILELLDDETLRAPKKLPKSGPDAYKKMNRKLEEKRVFLQNSHWTPEMRAAIPTVKALFASG